jgi:hypothetical protein
MAQNRNADVPDKGEGNHAADKRYRDETKRFVASGRVDEAARQAQQALEDDAEELEAAEEEGRAHVAEEDPEVKRHA